MSKSKGRCGYTAEYESLIVGNLCCWREVWKDTGRCVWHADKEDKPVSALKKSRLDSAEFLDGAHLRNAALGNAISFEGCRLRGANLSNAYLSGANFSNASLREADLSGTHLSSADLTDAYLRGANLTGAIVEVADLTDAALGDTDLTDASLAESDLSSARLTGADLTDTYLTRANLTDASFYLSDLTQAGLHRANLTNADFSDTTLKNAILEQANLTRTNFFGANLTGAKLYGAVFDNTQVSRATTFGDHYENVCEEEPQTSEDNDASAWDKACWTYRQLEQIAQDNALPERAREHFVTRKELRREEYRKLNNQFRLLNFQWLKATGSRYIMRYGEGWKNVIYTSFALIGLFALLYPLVGGINETPSNGVTTHGFDLFSIPNLIGPLPDVFVTLLTSFYFSFVTFTTLGYGDMRPATGTTQMLVTIESFLGALLMALLVFVLGRRTTW